MIETLSAPRSSTEMIPPHIIVGDLGGTWSRVAYRHGENERIVRYRTPTAYSEAIKQMSATTAELLGNKRPDAIGFGVAGQLDPRGVVTQAGKLAEYGWVGQHVTADIAAEVNINPENVAGANDVAAAAKAEQQVRSRIMGEQYDLEGIFSISTGVGGALYTPDDILSLEPGHAFLRPGALCGCGADGCLEAYVSGSGIERNYGRRGENIPAGDPVWSAVRADLTIGFDNALNDYEGTYGEAPTRLSFYGSVALKGPDLLSSLRNRLTEIRGSDSPEITLAAYGDDSGLEGAYYLAQETLQS